MQRDEIADLTAFVAVAEERSFTRAASRLNVTQSALSQIIRRLEERLGVRLLARTTRSVAPTQAGERLFQSLVPLLQEIGQSVAGLSDFRDKPAGTIRITTVEHAAKTVLLPKLSPVLKANPDISVEIIVDYGLTDIVTGRYDAGVRLGEQVAKDMIAARISADIPMAIVGAPDYLKHAGCPQDVQELVEHRCINLKLPTADRMNAWRLSQDGEEIRAQVDGPFAFNSIDLIRDAALYGDGLAYLPRDQVATDVKAGALKQVLTKQTPPLPGYHLYYPNRRHASPAFKLIVDAVRYR